MGADEPGDLSVVPVRHGAEVGTDRGLGGAGFALPA
jgi:hypothetical protein